MKEKMMNIARNKSLRIVTWALFAFVLYLIVETLLAFNKLYQ